MKANNCWISNCTFAKTGDSVKTDRNGSHRRTTVEWKRNVNFLLAPTVDKSFHNGDLTWHPIFPALVVNYIRINLVYNNLVPRPLPDFISQAWRKIRRRPGIKTTQNYVTDRKWWFVLTESTISVPWRSFDPRLSPDFSPRLWDKIWEWPGDEAKRIMR